ncbi:hypothetical protein [Micromonospora sp. NBC_01796]|uniref:hypothetical protein n=1 Tax=Micromonospora sp. NBC_01796 TaxID=2975987 RepID=UPI002DD8077E|nr:hypothetical protein [Micromonospora sp. NBC_01796]WSA86691.1 hypothetical protein OIE47_03435 [Micromonospora sp. NBC_01796]
MLIAEAVSYVQATVAVGAADAAVVRAAGYAGDRVWSRLTDDWSGRNCKGLARLARAALDGKDWLHGRIGDLVGLLLELLGTPRVARDFGKEVAKRIPLPWDQQLVAVARGMQIAGIAVCVVNGRNLAKCDCFIDVVVNEGKERVRQLMEWAAKDWRNLEHLAPVA